MMNCKQATTIIVLTVLCLCSGITSLCCASQKFIQNTQGPAQETNLSQSLINLSPEEESWIKEHPSITVSNEFDWPPFDFTHLGKPYGFGIDLMELISQYSGIHFNYVNGYTWEQLVEKFFKGEIDLLHSLSVTPDRAEKSYFSPPYYHSKNVVIFRQDSTETNVLEDLEGKIIAIPKGWSSIQFFKTHYPKIHIVEVTNSRQALEYVDQGKVFATVEQHEIAEYLIKKFGFHDLRLSKWIDNDELQKTSSMHFAVLKENPILFHILLKALNNIPVEELENLKNKWFSREGIDLGREDVGLTPDERQFLKAKRSISFCVPPEVMPFAALKNNQLTGMASDFIDIFSEQLNIPFTLLSTTSWTESEQKFNNGECEVLPIFTMPGKVSKNYDFTSPLLHFQSAIITRDDEGFIAGLQHFMGKKLATVKHSINTEKILSLYPHITVLPFENTEDCLLHVSNKTADGALLALPVAAYYIRHMGLTNLQIAGYSGSEGSLRIAMNKDQPYLHSIMSKLIRSIPQHDINRVYEKWISLRFDHKVDYRVLWKAFAGVLLLVLLVLLWNRQLFQLNKKIAEANRKLEEQSLELKKISITDVLTGIYNRRYADNKLEEEIARANRYKGNLSIIITDLDEFKNVNDTWGHQTGDSALQKFAETLTKNTRESDIVSRWGGDEFLIICPETDIQGAVIQTENLRKIFSSISFKDIGHRTASFGVATYIHGESKNSAVHRADEALYLAKKKGRNRVEPSRP